jgi:hypothetical protein
VSPVPPVEAETELSVASVPRPKVDLAAEASACLKNPVVASSMNADEPISATSPDPVVGFPTSENPDTGCIFANVTESFAIVVTPELEIVTSPVTATDVGTLVLLPTSRLPLDSGASLEYAIAAEALMSALTTAPLAIEVTPVLEIVTSPVTATDVGMLLLFPTRIFPLDSGASLLKEIAALLATESFVTEFVAGTETPASEMVKI